MIVSCPSCSARYKLDETKVQSRGAKITCPRCAHKFVVYRPDAPPADEHDEHEPSASADEIPDDLSRRDFSQVGISWRVRKGLGLIYDFRDLDGLRQALEDGQIDRRDALTFDNRSWQSIESIDDLEALFWDTWVKAARGDLQIDGASPADTHADEDDEDDTDAPTQVVRQGSPMADSLRRAIEEMSDDPDDAGAPAAASAGIAAATAGVAAGAQAVVTATPSATGPRAEAPAAPRAEAPAAPRAEAPAPPKAAPQPQPQPPSAPATGTAAQAQERSGGSGVMIVIGIVVIVAIIGAVALFATGGFESLSGPDPAPGITAPVTPGNTAPTQAAPDRSPAAVEPAGAATPADSGAVDDPPPEDIAPSTNTEAGDATLAGDAANADAREPDELPPGIDAEPEVTPAPAPRRASTQARQRAPAPAEEPESAPAEAAPNEAAPDEAAPDEAAPEEPAPADAAPGTDAEPEPAEPPSESADEPVTAAPASDAAPAAAATPDEPAPDEAPNADEGVDPPEAGTADP